VILLDRKKLEMLYNQLISLRGAVEASLILLNDELFNDEEDSNGKSTCSHKDRKSFTTLGGKEHWICRDCGYEYKEE
jgi:hypothetical protein